MRYLILGLLIANAFVWSLVAYEGAGYQKSCFERIDMNHVAIWQHNHPNEFLPKDMADKYFSCLGY